MVISRSDQSTTYITLIAYFLKSMATLRSFFKSVSVKNLTVTVTAPYVA